MGTPPKTPDHWGKCRSYLGFPPKLGWVEISSGENIRLDARYKSSAILVKRLVDQSAVEKVLKTMEYYAKKISVWPTLGGGRA